MDSYPSSITEQMKKLTAKQEKQEKLIAEIRVAEIRLEELQKMRKAAKPTCTMCGRGWQTQHLDRSITSMTEKVSGYQLKRDEAMKLTSEIKAVQDWKDEMIRSGTDLAVQAETIKNAEQQKEILEEEVKARDKAIAAAAGDPAKAEELRRRVRNGTGVMATIQAYIAHLKRESTRSDQQSATQARLEALERICEALGPKGAVRSQLIDSSKDEFMTEVQSVGKVFELGIDISMEPFGAVVNGLDAVSGLSFLVDRAVRRLKPMTPNGCIIECAPPEIITSASPLRISIVASPTA